MTPLVNISIAVAAVLGLPVLIWTAWKAWAWVRATMAYIAADDGERRA